MPAKPKVTPVKNSAIKHQPRHVLALGMEPLSTSTDASNKAYCSHTEILVGDIAQRNHPHPRIDP